MVIKQKKIKSILFSLLFLFVTLFSINENLVTANAATEYVLQGHTTAIRDLTRANANSVDNVIGCATISCNVNFTNTPAGQHYYGTADRIVTKFYWHGQYVAEIPGYEGWNLNVGQGGFNLYAISGSVQYAFGRFINTAEINQRWPGGFDVVAYVYSSNIKLANCTWNGGAIIKNPTCTTTGIRRYTCTACHSITDVSINATGHSWSWINDTNATCTTNGTRHQHCSRCGANQNYGSVWQNALGHAYDGGIITEYPTVYRNGIRTFTCSRCNSTNTVSEPPYHFNINVGYTPIKKIAKGNNLLFENTSMDADLIPFVSK